MDEKRKAIWKRKAEERRAILAEKAKLEKQRRNSASASMGDNIQGLFDEADALTSSFKGIFDGAFKETQKEVSEKNKLVRRAVYDLHEYNCQSSVLIAFRCHIGDCGNCPVPSAFDNDIKNSRRSSQEVTNTLQIDKSNTHAPHLFYVYFFRLVSLLIFTDR